MKPAILEEVSKMLDIELNLARRRLALLMVEFGGSKWYEVSPELFKTFKGIKDCDIEIFKDKIRSRLKSITSRSKKLDFDIHSKGVASTPDTERYLNNVKVFIRYTKVAKLPLRDLELMLHHSYGAIIVATEEESDMIVEYRKHYGKYTLKVFVNNGWTEFDRYIKSLNKPSRWQNNYDPDDDIDYTNL